MIKTAEEWFTELYNSNANDDYQGWNSEACLEVICAIQLDAIKHGMTLSVDAIQHGKDIDSVNADLAWCQTAILTACDNLKEI